MAEKRKLLAEMEKVFRKIEEGVAEFLDIHEKMIEANSDNQRDKLQDDLKKEIKKLQRLRDQIKGWQGSNDIKDKDKLMEYRKMIENRMEQFKDIERENKTKPHSKQGLLIEDKMDPKLREKNEALEWVSNTVHKLGEQIDVYECEMSNLSNSGGKKAKKLDKDKVARIEAFQTSLDKHKHHSRTLEVVMRLVNNESISFGLISDDIKEAMEQYMESYMEDDPYDADWIYEDMNLDQMNEMAHQLGNVTNIGTLDEAENVEEEGSPNPDTARAEGEDGQDRAGKIGGKARHTSGSVDHDTTSHHLTSAPVKSAPPPPLKLTTQTSLDSAAVHPSTIGAMYAQRPITPVAPTPPTMSYNSVAATGVRAVKPTAVRAQSSQPMQPTIATPPVHTTPIGDLSLTSSAPSSNLKPSLSSMPYQSSDDTKGSVASSLNLSALSLGDSDTPTARIAQMSSTDTIIAQQSSAMSSPRMPVATDQMDVASLAAMAQQAMSSSSTPNSPGGLRHGQTSSEQCSPHASSNTQAMSVYKLINETQRAIRSDQPALGPQSAHIPPALGASPLGRVTVSEEQSNHLAALNSAMAHMPVSMDSERLRCYLPRTPWQTPSYYPQSVPPHADTYEYFVLLQPETLFFIFYYLEGTRAQYLAAKALKSKSWRFHKKYLMWFQRYEEPKEINDDFEMGAYIYFDFEKWMQRKKDGFTFEYRYLEDRDL